MTTAAPAPKPKGKRSGGTPYEFSMCCVSCTQLRDVPGEDGLCSKCRRLHLESLPKQSYCTGTVIPIPLRTMGNSPRGSGSNAASADDVPGATFIQASMSNHREPRQRKRLDTSTHPTHDNDDDDDDNDDDASENESSIMCGGNDEGDDDLANDNGSDTDASVATLSSRDSASDDVPEVGGPNTAHSYSPEAHHGGSASSDYFAEFDSMDPFVAATVMLHGAKLAPQCSWCCRHGHRAPDCPSFRHDAQRERAAVRKRARGCDDDNNTQAHIMGDDGHEDDAEATT
eukprot:PhM_4_TR5706/c0_g1_i1/m.41788